MRITQEVFNQIKQYLPLLENEFEVSEDGLSDKNLVLVQSVAIGITPDLFMSLQAKRLSELGSFPWKINGKTILLFDDGISSVDELRQWLWIADTVSNQVDL